MRKPNFNDVERQAITNVWINPNQAPLWLFKAPYRPVKGLLQGCPYTPAKDTDVRETWRRFGWSPIKPELSPMEMLNNLTIYRKEPPK